MILLYKKRAKPMGKAAPILSLCLALLLSGCRGRGGIYSNYREIEHLLPVQTLGVDCAPTGLRLSVSCAMPGGQGKPGIICRDGSSLLSAMDSLQDYSAAGQLYYSHARYVLLGEDYARAGVDETLDFLARDGRMRMGLLLFVVREGSASALVTDPRESGYDITEALSTIHREDSDRGLCPVLTVRETIRQLSESGAALVCAVKAQDREGSVFPAAEGTTALADGCGIIKDGRLVDFIDRELAAAAAMLLGGAGDPHLQLELPEGGSVELSIGSAKARLSPRWEENGALDHIRVELKLQGALAELHSRQQKLITDENMETLSLLLEEQLSARLEALLARSVELEADFLGLMGRLRRDKAAFADALPEDWLSRARFEISVEAEIRDAGDMGNPMNNRGWGN